MSEIQDPLLSLLVRRSRGEARAVAIVEDLSNQLGIPAGTADRALTAVALIKTGATPESISALLSWNEFEDFCAGILRATGYGVKRNIVMTKPRRQIDIFADSPSLSLSVDCKHWGRSFTSSALERIAAEQVERTSLYKKKKQLPPTVAVLPMVLTLLDVPARLVRGVPFVPVFALRDFLTRVSRFEEGLEIL